MRSPRFDVAVAVAADPVYAWPAVLTLISAGTRSSASTLCLLFGDELSSEFVDQAEQMFARARVPFKYAALDLSAHDPFPLRNYLSRTTYARLFVPEHVLPFAERTLYLDADALVVGDIAPLVELDLCAGRIVAAVRDRWIRTVASPDGVRDWEEHRIDPATPFFNAGVLLIENGRWTAENVGARVASEIQRNPAGATFADQGALNAVLHDRWLELPQIWNYQPVLTPSVRVGPAVVSRRFWFSLRRLRILHYSTHLKPWRPDYPPGHLAVRYRNDWEHFLPVPPPAIQGYRHWLRRRYRT